MSIEIAVKNLIGDDEAISGMIGGRIYPQELPQGAVLPAVTYTVVSDMTGYTMRGAGTKRPRFQITAWGETPDDAFTLAGLIEGKLSGFRGLAGGVQIPGIFKEDGRDRFEEGFENVANRYGRDLDFYVWHKNA